MSTDSVDRPAQTKTALEEAEDLISRWDQESGLTYRELAIRLRDIFAKEERPKVGF